MKRLTRKEMILEIYDQEAMGEVAAREIAIINRRLVEEYGEGGALTPAEIARILVEEDLPVKFEEIFRMAGPRDRYETAFEGLAVNRSLEDAETSIRRIDQLLQLHTARNDKTGIRYARQTAVRARENASILAASKSISEKERREQFEIEQWFRIWLQSPGIFFIWLESRKSTAEYRRIFGSAQAIEDH
ncbi:MAG: hypothetical protein IPM66_11485 [Acidobacteriota bacterium]|nr:MAG: hypothetical protein IPM66_11485 [Acidobacteriota bacterium]